MILTMDNVSKKYRDKWAVQSFSLELSSGGVYGLLGPNGAGKTTLLRMLVDISKPTSGQIMLDGQPIEQMGDRYRRILGYWDICHSALDFITVSAPISFSCICVR
ncbi:Lipopolysaccharide export system ATP-binding protein LptB [compost metagenome]